MVQVRIETLIRAPLDVCFDAARDMAVHAKTMAHTGETIIDGPHGLLEFCDLVTFEAKHLGIRQRLTAKITRMEPPHIFVDQMVKGAFKFLEHEHIFQAKPEGTLMIDILRFEAPMGVLGWLVERLVLKGYMQRLLRVRGMELRDHIESLPAPAEPADRT